MLNRNTIIKAVRSDKEYSQEFYTIINTHFVVDWQSPDVIRWVVNDLSIGPLFPQDVLDLLVYEVQLRTPVAPVVVKKKQSVKKVVAKDNINTEIDWNNIDKADFNTDENDVVNEFEDDNNPDPQDYNDFEQEIIQADTWTLNDLKKTIAESNSLIENFNLNDTMKKLGYVKKGRSYVRL